MLRFLVALLTLATLAGCSNDMAVYKHREFWRDAQLEYEPENLYLSEDPSIGPGDSIVLLISDGAYPLPPEPGEIGSTVHPSYTTYKIQIPGDVRAGDVVSITSEPASLALCRSTGYTHRQIDCESPFEARIHILAMNEEELRADVEIRCVQVKRSKAPRAEWNPEPIRLRTTDTFARRTDYVAGLCRVLHELESEINARGNVTGRDGG